MKKNKDDWLNFYENRENVSYSKSSPKEKKNKQHYTEIIDE